MKIVEKTIKAKTPIVQRLYEVFYHYKQDWREEPEGLLLGPNEWIEFSFWIRENAYQRSDLGVDETLFLGLAVIRMSRHGVDVIPSESVARYMAVGTVKQREL